MGQQGRRQRKNLPRRLNAVVRATLPPFNHGQIAAQFPLCSVLPITPVVTNGWDNRTFRLGNELSVRLPSAEPYAAQVKKEHQWLPALAPMLPLPIPVPLAKGLPAEGYPWHWSVYRWLDGDNTAAGCIDDWNHFAAELARFLTALWNIDAAQGPAPGSHNFFRGGPLTTYDQETRDAIAALRGQIETDAASPSGCMGTSTRRICWFAAAASVLSSTLDAWAWAIPPAT